MKNRILYSAEAAHLRGRLGAPCAHTAAPIVFLHLVGGHGMPAGYGRFILGVCLRRGRTQRFLFLAVLY